MNNAPTVMGTNKCVLYHLRINYIIIEEELAKIESLFALRLLQLFTLSVWRGAQPTPSCSDKNLYLYKWQPAHITFYVGYVFFWLAFVLVSQLPSSHRGRLSQIHRSREQAALSQLFSPLLSLNERGGYKNYTDPSLGTRYRYFVRIWVLIYRFLNVCHFSTTCVAPIDFALIDF